MKKQEWKIRFSNFAIVELKVSQGGPCPKGGRAGCWPSCTMAEAAPSADMIRRDQPEARSGILERYIKSDQIVRGHTQQSVDREDEGLCKYSVIPAE